MLLLGSVHSSADVLVHTHHTPVYIHTKQEKELLNVVNRGVGALDGSRPEFLVFW